PTLPTTEPVPPSTPLSRPAACTGMASRPPASSKPAIAGVIFISSSPLGPLWRPRLPNRHAGSPELAPMQRQFSKPHPRPPDVRREEVLETTLKIYFKQQRAQH